MIDLLAQIKEIKEKSISLPNVEKFQKQYDEQQHEIMVNTIRYPNREIITVEKDEYGVKTERITGIEPITRIPLPLQKEIVSKAVTFLFGTEVKYTDPQDELIYESFLSVLEKDKSNDKNREIAALNSRFTQCAEIWYLENETNNYYGFQSNFRLKSLIINPLNNKLYPVFDRFGNMTTFMREFSFSQNNNNITVNEIYTNETITTITQGVEMTVETQPNLIGKIPVVFYQYENVEWSVAQNAIERKEEILSDMAESNKRTAYPIMVVKGRMEGRKSKTRVGGAFELDETASLEFVQPANGSENLAKEMEYLDSVIYNQTRTPKLSLEDLTGAGNMLASASSAQFYFLTAHLKVREKESIYVSGLQRRMSIIESFLKVMNRSLFANLSINAKPVITPFIIDNEESLINMLMTANGNQPVFSQRDSMEKLGIKDPDAMIREINEEFSNRASNEESSTL